jgi:cytoskeletal protein RodZ
MNNRVDNFFKNKLKEHQLPPSAKGWEKLERNLSKKNKTILWFRLAAAIALVGILTFAILQWMVKGDPQPQLVIQENKSASPKIVESEKEITQPQEKSMKERSIETKREASKKAVAATTSLKKQKLKEKGTPSAQAKEELLISEVKQEPISEKKTLEKAENAIIEKPITLVFTLPTLKTKNGLTAEEVAGEEKKTALQKVVETANEIRTGDVLGELREAKNELFAREFKKDKSKKN